MSIIQVKFDNTLKQTDIIIPLTNSSKDEAGSSYVNNQPEIQATLVHGIQSPLIMINNIVVDFMDVISFELKCTSSVPEVIMVIRDRYQLNSIVDTPSIDNELRVQVLPKFDNIYKKINLTFYITSIRFKDEYMSIKGVYKSPKYMSSYIKTFGEISTYTLFETIAKDTGLGFASNVENNDGDKRLIYCDNKSYKELLMDEIQKSGTGKCIYDYWIDWWNNIVLIDIYERYNAIDQDEDMQIYISGQNKEVSEGNEILPQKVVASLHNHPGQKMSELFVYEKNIINKPGTQLYSGTDKIYTVFEHSKGDYVDYLIQDSDVENDIFIKHEYLGEVYGDFNYLIAGKKREAFLQKIRSNETIEIVLKTPLLGLMRGNRINLLWYINDSSVQNLQDSLTKDNLLQENPDTNISLNCADFIEDMSQNGSFVLDKSISGQYLITGCKMGFWDKEWHYKLILSRPTSSKPKLINEN